MLEDSHNDAEEPDSCNNCYKKTNGTCTKVRRELCDEYERGVGFTEEEKIAGYYGGNEGDASRFRKQKKIKN